MAKRKRVGRPPKPPEERRRGHFTFRTTDKLREQLRDAAGVSGRSISEEIEIRLLQSFQKEGAARDVARALLEHFEEREVFDFAKKTIQEQETGS
jgi:hypothetical protein